MGARRKSRQPLLKRVLDLITVLSLCGAIGSTWLAGPVVAQDGPGGDDPIPPEVACDPFSKCFVSGQNDTCPDSCSGSTVEVRCDEGAWYEECAPAADLNCGTSDDNTNCVLYGCVNCGGSTIPVE